MKKISRKDIIKSNEISEIREYNLGGYPQKVLIDGKLKRNPIVIALHGGPGTPIPFSVGCRGFFPDITEKLTMVYWDQLGCGINNYPIDNTFTIEDYVDMTYDLIRELRNEFQDNKIILFGVSWGSILALKVAKRASELIDGVVTYGQVLCNMTFNDEVYNALENSKMSQKEKAMLSKIKDVKCIENAKKLMSWVGKYTEGYQCKSGQKTPMAKIIFGLLTSPDYKLSYFKAIVVNGYLKNTSLMNELIELDLKNEFSDVQIPYTIIQGRTDIVTSTNAIMQFVQNLNNHNIKFICAPNSGHMPDGKAMDVIMGELMSSIQ